MNVEFGQGCRTEMVVGGLDPDFAERLHANVFFCGK